ncbi:hypothetical protein [Thiolapillus sp.]
MRSLIKLGFGCGLLTCAAAMADGYYPGGNDGSGAVNWPPPGGVFVSPPAVPEYIPPVAPGFHPYPDSRPIPPYYRPAQHFDNELIEPPGSDWPDAAYYEPPEKMPPPPRRPLAGRGAPVEVVPPPSIPAEEVNTPLLEKPARVWRPVEKRLESLGETAVSPKFVERREPLQREAGPSIWPPQAKGASSPFVSGMAIARPQTSRLPPLDKPAEK